MTKENKLEIQAKTVPIHHNWQMSNEIIPENKSYLPLEDSKVNTQYPLQGTHYWVG